MPKRPRKILCHMEKLSQEILNNGGGTFALGVSAPSHLGPLKIKNAVPSPPHGKQVVL